MKILFPPWMENLAAPDGESAYLGPEDLKDLKPFMRLHHLNARQPLFDAETMPLGIYGVTKGSFCIYKIGLEGREQIFDFALPGALLGLRAMVAGETYSASAVAREKSSVCFYEGRSFMRLLEAKPSLARAVLTKVGRQLREARGELLERSVASVSSRLAHWILHVEAMYRAQDLPPWVTGQELAGMVGAAPETISRQIAKFRAARLIERKGFKIKVLNRVGLIQEAGELFRESPVQMEEL